MQGRGDLITLMPLSHPQSQASTHVRPAGVSGTAHGRTALLSLMPVNVGLTRTRKGRTYGLYTLALKFRSAVCTVHNCILRAKPDPRSLGLASLPEEDYTHAQVCACADAALRDLRQARYTEVFGELTSLDVAAPPQQMINPFPLMHASEYCTLLTIILTLTHTPALLLTTHGFEPHTHRESMMQ